MPLRNRKRTKRLKYPTRSHSLTNKMLHAMTSFKFYLIVNTTTPVACLTQIFNWKNRPLNLFHCMRKEGHNGNVM